MSFARKLATQTYDNFKNQVSWILLFRVCAGVILTIKEEKNEIDLLYEFPEWAPG